MKKILVLMLVFGIASMATAGLTLSGPTTVVEGGTVTLTLTADAASVFDNPGDYGYIHIGSDSFSNVAMLTAMSDGDMSGFLYEAGTYTYFYFVGSNAPSEVAPPLSAGAWLTFDVIASSTLNGGTIGVIVNPFSATPGSTFNITVIPEPMTIGLLGLGGLFLRRRK